MAQPYPLRKATKRVLVGETLAEEAARLERAMRTWRAQPFLLATGVEEQPVHSTFRAGDRRGDREEDNAEGPRAKSDFRGSGRSPCSLVRP